MELASVSKSAGPNDNELSSPEILASAKGPPGPIRHRAWLSQIGVPLEGLIELCTDSLDSRHITTRQFRDSGSRSGRPLFALC